MPAETDKVIHQIHGELIEFRSEMKTRAGHFQELLEDHHTTLYGDGNGTPGMRVRMDRLEQSSKAREKHIFAIWTAVLGSAVAWLTGLFHRP